MNINAEDLQNPDLKNIVSTLFPPKSEGNVTALIPPSSSSSTGSASALNSDPPSSEFIPYIYYALFQILKGQNTSTNQLETKTGFIRHRLRSCKDLIKGNEAIISLLCRSTDEWKTIIRNRENELQVKRNVLQHLGERIDEIIGREEERGKPGVDVSKDGEDNRDDASFDVDAELQDTKLEDSSEVDESAILEGDNLTNGGGSSRNITGASDNVSGGDNNDGGAENKADSNGEDLGSGTFNEEDFEMELD